MADYRTLISRGQVAVTQATFTDSETGNATNPTAVTMTVTRVDSGGRFVEETYTWSGVDTPYIENPAVGVFRGVYPVPDEDTTFQIKLEGTGAIVGATETVYYLVTP